MTFGSQISRVTTTVALSDCQNEPLENRPRDQSVFGTPPHSPPFFPPENYNEGQATTSPPPPSEGDMLQELPIVEAP